jgi:arylsulfatase A-like enzyme
MKKPNFLLFITDQHRADNLGCYGNQIVKTPNIDSISARGTKFEKFYVANPLCQPNRSSLMTGRMPSVHGVRCNGTPLSLSARTYVEHLSNNGYETALIGKSHLQNMTGKKAMWSPSSEDFAIDDNGVPLQAFDWNMHGLEYENENPNFWRDKEDHAVITPFYGFNHVDLCTEHSDEVGGAYERWLLKKEPDGNNLRGRRNCQSDNKITTPQAWKTKLPEELYPSAYIGDMTLDYLDKHAASKDNDPFFIQCSFPDPHHPFTPPGKYWDMYNPDDMPIPTTINDGDSNMEVFLREQLEKGEAVRDTQTPYAANAREIQEAMALTFGMITMIDDQIGRVLARLKELGLDEDTVIMFTSDHGDYMGDHGLMLKGPLHLQGMIRVPFIWSDPESRKGKTTSSLAQTIDISRTVLDRAGIKPYWGIQGTSILGDITASQPTNRDAILIEDDRQRINLGFTRFQKIRTLITKQHRFTLGYPDARDELYDLIADPGELNNLWESEPKLRAELTDKLMRMSLEYQDPTPLAPGLA